MELSKRIQSVSESVTMKLNALVGELKAQGEDVINLTAGEPDSNVHEAAKEAVKKAVDDNKSKYAPAPGFPELREAVAKKTNAQQPSMEEAWKKENVLVTNGGKQALFNTFLCILNAGDEVIIPAPFWVSYPDMVKIAEGTPVIVSATAEQNFKITPEQLKKAITPKTKAFVINSPSNPTGMLYSKEELKALGEVLKDHPQVWILSDEIYDQINFGEIPFCSFGEACPDLKNQLVTVNGMSKSAAMTGWRIGWLVAPLLLTKAATKLQGQSTSGINSLVQWASIAALELPSEVYENQAKIFHRRRDLVLEILSKSEKIECVKPQGAFYAFLGIKNCLSSGEDSVSFAERLLQNAKVAVVPGAAFGDPNSVRLSYATDDRTLQEGCKRLLEYVESSQG